MTYYSELVKALQCKALSKQCDSCKYGYHLCPDSECNDACHVEQIYADAADAIEELQATIELMKPFMPDFFPDANNVVLPKLEPKRGEWIFKSTGGSMGFKTCSVCGYQSWQSKLDLGNMGNYCPNCGAKMGGTDE